MKMLKLAIMAAALAAASSARADLLVLTGVGSLGGSDYTYVTLAASGAINIPAEGVEAGFYNLTVNGVPTPSFCIDIARDQSVGTPYSGYSSTTLSSAPFGPSGPMGHAAATVIEQLWTKYYPLAATEGSAEAAALQVAIWQEVEIGNNATQAALGHPENKYTLIVDGNNPSDPIYSAAQTMLGSLSGVVP